MSKRNLLAAGLLAILGSFSAAFAADGDSLTTFQETAYGTDPNLTDTDGDTLADDEEVFHGSNPNSNDTDLDGVTDGAEADWHAVVTPASGPYTGVNNATFGGLRSGMIDAASGQSAQDGVGVWMHEGSFHYSVSVAGAKGVRGVDQVLNLTYDSKSAYDGRVGKNWTSVFDCYLTIDISNHAHVLLPGSTTELLWTWNGGGWDPPLGRKERLDDPGGSIYTLTSPGGDMLTYDTTTGLEQAEDRFGNTIDYVYSTGKIVSIVDSRGEAHSVSYYGTGRVQTVTMADGAAWTFYYNQLAHLWKVVGPATATFGSGIQWEFAYSSGFPSASLNNNLVTAWDGRGNDWLTVRYDIFDRVKRQYLGGSTTKYFLFDFTSIGSQETTVTDRAGNERVWKWHSTKLTKTELTEKTNRGVRGGEGDYTTTWSHDADGYLEEVTYPRGNGIKYTLNAVKRPTEVRRKEDMGVGDNNTYDIYDTYTYENSAKFYAVATHIDAEGNTTTFTNDSYGQPTTITHPTCTNVSPNVTVIEYLSYNADGTLDTTTDGEGYITQYDYYTTGPRTGRVSQKTMDVGGLDIATAYDYEDWGDLSSVTDPNTNVTTYTVERYGNVTQVDSDASLGYVTRYTHDGNLNVTKKEVKNIDHDGSWLSTPYWLETNFFYSTMDKLTLTSQKYTSVSWRTTNYGYDDNDNLSDVIRGVQHTEMTYDERDLLYERTKIGGLEPDAVEYFTYDGNRNTTVYRNARVKDTNYTFDLFDRRTQTTNALGHYEVLTYDKESHVVERQWYEEAGVSDVLRQDHTAAFDEMGRFYEEEDVLQGTPDVWYTRTYVFDKRGLVTKKTDRRSYDTDMTYDGAGRLDTVTDPMGNIQDFDYDANGNVQELIETDDIPSSASVEVYHTTFAYDALNRTISRTEIDNTNGSNTKVTLWERDVLDVVRVETDPKGIETTRVRDYVGRVTEEHRDMGSPDEIVTKWEFDVFDHVTKLTDDNNSETLYGYNDLGWLTLKTYEDTKTVAYEYDRNGNVSQITDQIGTISDLDYDDIDQLTDRWHTLGSGVGGDDEEHFVYDACMQLTQARDPDSIVDFTYDSLSHVKTEVQGSNPLGGTGKTTGYTYDAEGNRTKIDYASGFDANEARDSLGRVTAITDGSSASVASFDLYGRGLRKKRTTFGNSTTSNYTYDGFRRPTDIVHKTSAPATFAGFTYAWDDNDNPLYEIKAHNSGKGDVYRYDQANRLVKVLTDCDDPAAEIATPNSEVYVEKLEYDMDDVFNLTSYKVTPYGGGTSTTSFTADAMNLYTAVGAASPTYTDAGSLNDDETLEYVYDVHQHLIEVKDSTSHATTATYAYDALGLGRRTKKTVGAAVTRYVYANQQSIEEYDGSNNLRRLFVIGDRIDHVLMMEAPDAADIDSDLNTAELQRFYFHSQIIGSVTHITGPSQAVVESYLYDPYGKPTIKDQGGSPTGSSPIGNPYLFTARQFDEESGIFYYRARNYSPALKRFTQRDPVEYADGPNVFSYCHNTPVSRIDPGGLDDRDQKPILVFYKPGATPEESAGNAAAAAADAGVPGAADGIGTVENGVPVVAMTSYKFDLKLQTGLYGNKFKCRVRDPICVLPFPPDSWGDPNGFLEWLRLALHEIGHVILAREVASDHDDKDTDGESKEDADKEAEKAKEEDQEKQDKYDEDTAHGTQAPYYYSGKAKTE